VLDRSPVSRRSDKKPANHPDVAAARLFAGQHHVAAQAQLLAVGLTPHMVNGRVRTGAFVRVHRGVLRPAWMPLSDHGRLLAAVLACRPGSLASHGAAAWLWGLDEQPSCAVSVFGGRHPRPHGVAVHQVKLPAVPSLRHGIPVTNPLRTMLDLAVYGGGSELTRALDRGVAARLFTFDAVRAELDRWADVRRPGLPLLRAVLDDCGPVSMRSPSVLQNVFARLLRRAGLPPPVPEHEVMGGRYRLDFAYPDVLLACELDSAAFHSGWEETEADHRRRRVLARLGWTVLVYTADDVWREPESVVSEIHGELWARGVHCEERASVGNAPPPRTRRPGRGTPGAGPAPPSA
jgi:hypothetical protein